LAFNFPTLTKSDAVLSVARYTYKSGPLVNYLVDWAFMGEDYILNHSFFITFFNSSTLLFSASGIDVIWKSAKQ